MSQLDPKRGTYITASVADTIMAGTTTLLETMKAGKPDISAETFDRLKEMVIVKWGKKPTVGECKLVGIEISFKDLTQAYRYITALIKEEEELVTIGSGMMTGAYRILANMIKTKDEAHLFKGNANTEDGDEYEYDSVMRLQEYLGQEIRNIGEHQVTRYDDKTRLAVTPDGDVEIGFGTLEGIDVKNPRYDIHLKYLNEIVSPETFKKVSSLYYHQGLCSMSVLGSDKFHWMSVNRNLPKEVQEKYFLLERKDVQAEIEIMESRSKVVFNYAVEKLHNMPISDDLKAKYDFI